MGFPAALPLPAAASDRAGRPSCCPWGRVLLWTALLVLAPAASAAGTPSPHAGLPKAVVRLEPPWINVLRGDSVTLHCQGPQGPGDGPTQWSRDGTPIPTQDQPRFSLKAGLNDSGDYRCQLDQTSLSDPVHLNVTSDWLLLQTPRLRLQEGDPLLLRCHSWMSRPLFKISFFQDGRAKWYSPSNASFFIPHANASHGGRYHCSGSLGRSKYESQPVSIAVQAASGDDPFPVTIVVAAVAGIAAVAGVAAVVAWVCLRRRQSSANLSHAEEAAKAEAENTITYSLLMHPEEEAGLSDYQNV